MACEFLVRLGRTVPAGTWVDRFVEDRRQQKDETLPHNRMFGDL